MKNKNQNNAVGLAGAILTVIGTAVGVFMAYKSEDIQKEVLARAKQAAKSFKKTRKEVQKNVQEIFGEVSEDLEKKYLEVQSNVLASAHSLNGPAKFTQKKYHEIVDAVIKNSSKTYKWTKKTAESFSKNLKQDWPKQFAALAATVQPKKSTKKSSKKKTAKPAAKKSLKKVNKKPVKSAAKKASKKSIKKSAKSAAKSKKSSKKSNSRRK
jgi:hypothetical protein